MINEALEAREILAGKPVGEKTRYRACLILAKWFHRQGMSFEETRAEIFRWANSQGYFLNDRVNAIVKRARVMNDDMGESAGVRVSRADVAEIERRFDKRNTRLAALAFLCYAKVHADRNGEFDISCSALAEWIGVNQGNFSKRILPELIDFGYLEKKQTDSSKASFAWNKTLKTRTLRVKLNASICNEGEYSLTGNDIGSLYEICFSKIPAVPGY